MQESTTLRRRKRFCAIAAIALLACAVAAPARALSISVVPSASTVEAGAAVNLAVVVNGLGAADERIGAFDLDLVFDPVAFAFTSIAYGNAFGPADLVLTGEAAGSDRVDFALLSFLDDVELAALQGDSVTLATLAFRALAPGAGAFALDPLAFPGIAVNGAGPRAPLLEFADIAGATVRVNARVEVPEPPSGALALLALAAVAGMRARRRARSGS